MSNRQTRELRELHRHDLELRLQEAKNEVMAVRFNLATRKTENTARLEQAKRQIARILTILGEDEQEA
jgi:large subunit ribosomal protein L29